MRRSVPSWPKGGKRRLGAGPPQAARPGAMAPPSARPGLRLWPRSPRGAEPTLARTGWGRPPGPVALLSALLTGGEAIDWPCFGPSRTAAPVPPGGDRFSGRPGYTTAGPRASAADRSDRWYTGGPCAAAHRSATGPYGPERRPQKAEPRAETHPGAD